MGSIPTWRNFEDLARRILEANHFSIQQHLPRGDRGFDFIGDLSGERWAIEVKYYRTARPQPNLIESAATRVNTNGASANATKGMLVVSCFLTPELRLALENRFPITFIDRVDLRNWASSHSPALIEELDTLVEADTSMPEGFQFSHQSRKLRSDSLSPVASSLLDTHGTQLCEELKQVKKGKAGWKEYESTCERILRYLFPTDLHGWHAQKRTDDGLSRFDFVCRIHPTKEFWKFLINHLNSRYVLFEFKNYIGRIKQGQILTTEKYLLELGLRRVAIIFTRAGADKHAIAMTQGAMREHGKLMLIVSDENLCEMLHMKQRGEDPTDHLFDLADDFMLALPR